MTSFARRPTAAPQLSLDNAPRLSLPVTASYPPPPSFISPLPTTHHPVALSL
jgi:hypothetical protein